MGRARTHSATTVRCNVCNQNFGRQEHLTRHSRIHTLEKPYQCSLCGKHFSRLDVLNRHTASHEQTQDSPAPSSSRACKQCAADRVRCSRGQPCKRCMDRKSTCWYPTGRKVPQRNGSRSEDEQLQLQNQQNPTVVLDATDNICLPVCFDSTGSSTFPSNSSGDRMTWASTYSDAPELCAFEQPGLSTLGVNWMSPQYQDDVDWDSLLAGFAVPVPREEVTDMYQQPPQPLHLNTMQSPRSSGPPTSGIYYVDGAGARVPFAGRSHGRGSIAAILTDSATSPESPGSSSVAHSLCPQASYENLVQHVVSEIQLHRHDFSISAFPSQDQIQLYVLYYFENFHPIFPFVRKASFDQSASSDWLLLLAVAVVGSRYVRRLHGSSVGDMLFAILDAALQYRRYGYGIQHGTENDTLFVPGQQAKVYTCPSIQNLQAGILNVMLLQHSGRKALVERAFVERHYLVEACHTLELISRPPEYKTTNAIKDSLQDWLVRETEIRVGMMIWFLDSIFLYEFDAKPLMNMDDIKAELPCHEDIWESPTNALQGNMFTQVSLLNAMESMYMEKKLPSQLGEFSSALLVMAIYRNTRRIVLKEQIRLNSWTPSAAAQRRVDDYLSSTQPSWLPTDSTTIKWRNSACDCLDVLHWSANSKIAHSAGSEHHTILNLHLARLIILTPTTYIQTLATKTASIYSDPGNSGSNLDFIAARHQILQWAVRDQCKARLSIIHCGALLWHIRRYSRDSILEPYGIYMATLVLWAFCVSMQLPEVVDAMAQDCEEKPEPSFLHIDRPLDDELVQMYVRIGYKMSAHISNIGNILDQGAPAKILQEGISLLSEGSRASVSKENDRVAMRSSSAVLKSECTWGIEESYVRLLRDLLLATSNPTAVTEQ